MSAHQPVACSMWRAVSRYVARHATLLACVTALGCGVGTLHAQPARLDTAALRTQTLQDLLDSTRVASATAGVSTEARARYAELALRLTRPEIQQLGLMALGTSHVDFATIAKRKYAALTPTEAAALDTLAAIVEEEMRAPADAALAPARAVGLLSPIDAFNAGRRGRAMLEGQRRLAMFERKYGPHAPTRNGAEVALNYVAQFLPGFRTHEDESPSRAEVIAAYVPTWLAIPREGGKMNAVTVGDAGVRLYIWREGWGGTRGGVLRPGYISFGVLAAGARDGAFVSPFKGASRFGGFIGWGAAKIGVIGGRETRLLVTRQVQIVPWVF